ncbi:alpha/beta hydrolase [Sphingomonas sp. RS2018]
MTDRPDPRRSYPATLQIGEWRAHDGWPLRSFDWPVEGESRGSILFQTGRGDFFEKYLETMAHWHDRGWRVFGFDWRGQAGSGRTTPAAQVGHIDDYGSYIRDLRDFVAAQPAMAGPRVVVGHSMGGHLLLRGLVEGAVGADAAVLVAPMLGLRSPVGARVGESLAALIAGLGDPGRAAWKGNERPHTRIDRATLLTGDAARYDDEKWWQAHDPRLVTGPPSWRWLAQGFASTRLLRESAALRAMKVPVLMLIAEADQLVDPAAALAVAARLPDVRVVRFGAESAHEILRERDAVRNRALTEIDDFLDERTAA